jgi:hypothetical protein
VLSDADVVKRREAQREYRAKTKAAKDVKSDPKSDPKVDNTTDEPKAVKEVAPKQVEDMATILNEIRSLKS